LGHSPHFWQLGLTRRLSASQALASVVTDPRQDVC